MSKKIGIPKESVTGETRVAATPNTVRQLVDLGFEVFVERGAGIHAAMDDQAYAENGAQLVDHTEVWACPTIIKVNPPTDSETELLVPESTLISFFWPATNEALLNQLQEKKITVLAMDMVPRISRAQSMDALSSMANISGYRAVIEAANSFGRFFTGQITAAGQIPPAKVLVIGAGVAGLAAIGAATQLGAVVRAFDTRLEVAEQIESMGGEFLKLDFPIESTGGGDGYATTMSDEFIAAEMALFAAQAKEVDIIISTAAIPGQEAPKLITDEMVHSMKNGSVIVDLAALTGGNCTLTEPGQKITTDNGVTIIGYTDMMNRLPTQAAQLYANNIINLMRLLAPAKDGTLALDFDDDIIRNMTLTHEGDLMYPPPPIQVSAAPAAQKKAPTPAPAPAAQKKSLPRPLGIGLLGIAAILFLWLGQNAPTQFLNHMIVFVLSCVVGYYVIWNVTHSLHTPLMSVTNAISSIIILGALLQIGQAGFWVSLLAFVAILVASINIFGGFYVTRRMLHMFRKKEQ
ncbi:MAG TPA: Re/Si-specific NAD(P)(+) transhydrogenase subunit alpha [Paenalcaligenes sp.]|nr:Re/Si-specific NAD(P)(+) transhydrogenase subunit alpha [Paenalcaligenes sp.]